MKAAFSENYGPPEILRIRDMPIPEPKQNQILIRVGASTVSRTDCGIRLARPFIIRFFTGLFKPRFAISGSDFAGEIVQVGSDVRGFKKGERVFGFHDHGLPSHAEYMAIDATTPMERIPEGVDDDWAAASCEGAHYACNYVKHIKKSGAKKVMVNGGTGAIGSAAIQILKNMGISVTATAPTGYLERIRSLGADHVIDYLREDFTQQDEKFDVVFDSAGKSSFGQCRRILKPHGIYLSSELGPGAENLYLPLLTRFRKGPKVLFPVPVDIPGNLKHMAGMLKEGKFKPLIDRRYRIEDVVEAFNYADSGQKIGNVILDLDA